MQELTFDQVEQVNGGSKTCAAIAGTSVAATMAAGGMKGLKKGIAGGIKGMAAGFIVGAVAGAAGYGVCQVL